MLQPFSRYRVRRTFESLSEGEELTFVTQYRLFDRDTGYYFQVLVFVEKNLPVYLTEEANGEANMLEQPDLFFEKIGEVDQVHAEQELAARRNRDYARALENERHRMLQVAQKKMAKRLKT